MHHDTGASCHSLLVDASFNDVRDRAAEVWRDFALELIPTSLRGRFLLWISRASRKSGSLRHPLVFGQYLSRKMRRMTHCETFAVTNNTE